MNFKNIPKPFIVAEIGNNHEGSFKNAIKLVKSAKESGANAVKFQIFDPFKLSSPKDKKRISQLKKFSLKKKEIINLKKKCDDLGIIFFATPFDLESANFLNKIQKFFKISSGDNDYLDLQQKIRSFKKPVIISTGLMDYKSIIKVVKYFRKFKFYQKKQNLCLMHCVSAYPASDQKINLNSIIFLKKKFPSITVGYSDHTIGYKISSLSYVLGAEIIEKHFTLSNNFSSFRDHKISLNPKSFKSFVKEILYLKNVLGKSQKKINEEEKNNRQSIRRKLVLNKNLKKNDRIKKKDLLIVRSPEKGIFGSEVNRFLGKKLTKNVNKFDNLLLKDFI
ncbi:N-acetylneuraminate synthase family protein [Candidatus Pelagibacter sp.]|nr:N-acetylneuraminate synthase family protein [Candidatus Pelagibacter sp.]